MQAKKRIEWRGPRILLMNPPSRRAGCLPIGPPGVGGIDIGGMVYVGTGSDCFPEGEPTGPVIDASLQVAANAPSDTARFYSYDPTYEMLTPSERRVYLRWLASGRSDPNIETPCVRLYFLGLERRALLDDPDPAERAELFAEVERLRKIYGDDENIAEELDRFLDLAPIFDALGYVPGPEGAGRTQLGPVAIAAGGRPGAQALG